MIKQEWNEKLDKMLRELENIYIETQVEKSYSQSGGYYNEVDQLNDLSVSVLNSITAVNKTKAYSEVVNEG